HRVANESLDIEDGLSAVELDGFADQNEAVAGPHRAAKADIFEAPEADEIALHQAVGGDVVTAQLRRRLAHEHAGQKRIIGHVAAQPEFVRLHVLVTNDDMLGGIDVDDCSQLLHFKALWIDLTNSFLIADDAGQIQTGWIKV